MKVQSKPDILVFGASGHAKVVIDAIEREGKFSVAGLIDNYKQLGFECNGHFVIGNLKDLPSFLEQGQVAGGILAISDNWTRSVVREQIKQIMPGFNFVSIVHPRANIGNKTTIGPGTIVLAGANVGPSCSVGAHCIINTLASLDHDSVMEDYSSLAPSAITGGNVNIGSFSAICLGAKIIHKISIGPQTVIGAGAIVVKDIPSNCVAYGTPAKIIRERKPGDSYF